ncbi:salicylate hydroxylase [Mytilinidion resinicola]|uniref:Salicylate hydroxylase n=1 Tax=Mytilinidion resinicola TaxID=574789 RepID=A0A6A6YAJ2_9PEZI|nr:salicylate hydroxylase [Mytilinidion resinicola]KAF2805842.1 salicylate hydroxylase [Mytilinidion resinicola]
MPISNLPSANLKIAIIGAGPAGLGALITLSILPFVTATIYEKKDEVSEIGAGISIQPNTWRMLEHMGAAEVLQNSPFHRAADGHSTQHRNGRTGKLISAQFDSAGTPLAHHHARCHRGVLQSALRSRVDPERVKTAHRLTQITHLPSHRIHLAFANGVTDEVDLLIGADGIRSVVREVAFPEHRIAYTGRTSYRTLVRAQDVAVVKGMGNEKEAVAFWHAPGGRWAYTCNLSGGVFEITTMVREEAEGVERVSWGQDVAAEKMLEHFADFHKPVREVLKLAEKVQQYALFAGPRLPKVHSGAIALIGDASHPLSGAFGNGAGFALEDAYVVSQSLLWAHERNKAIPEALQLFDRVRSPHYERLYAILDGYGTKAKQLENPNLHLSFDEEVAVLVTSNWSGVNNWMHYYNVSLI